jgi:hypothetical protein
MKIKEMGKCFKHPINTTIKLRILPDSNGYIKGIGFRQTLTGKQILQVVVKSTDKDFDEIYRWKDADSKDVIRAIVDGYIKTDSDELDRWKQEKA